MVECSSEHEEEGRVVEDWEHNGEESEGEKGGTGKIYVYSGRSESVMYEPWRGS